jgi:hypothetical protein
MLQTIGPSAVYAAKEGIRNKVDSTSALRSSTPASPSSTSEAHAGHRIELLPTESQSWHR